MSDSLEGLSDVEVLALVDAGIGRLRETVLDAEVDDDTLRAGVRRLQRFESRLYAEKLRRIAEVDARHAYRADGHRSPADWVADRCGVSIVEARRQVGTAAAMNRLPAAADQLGSGAITPGHADTVAHGFRDLERQAAQRRRDAGQDTDAYLEAIEVEEALIEQFDQLVVDVAPTVDRSALGRRLDAWTISNEPATIQARERRGLTKRGLTCSRGRDGDGLWDLRGKITDADKAQLFAGIDPLARKVSADDERTVAQRQLDALIHLAEQACDRGDLPAMSLQRPHVLLIDNQARRDGDPGAEPALLDGIGPVSNATAELFSCDADTTVITNGPDGRTWDVGHADGDPTTKQRKAVIARDKTCVGCGAPASRCHLHHIRWRRNGGGTYISNLVLVCWSCHQGVHHLGWNVTGDERTGFKLDRHSPDRHPAGVGAGGTSPPRHSS